MRQKGIDPNGLTSDEMVPLVWNVLIENAEPDDGKRKEAEEDHQRRVQYVLSWLDPDSSDIPNGYTPDEWAEMQEIAAEFGRKL